MLSKQEQIDSDTGIAQGIGNVNQFCTTTNGQTFIKEIQVECNGMECNWNITRANESSNVLSMLNYTKSYEDTVGKDQFFYLDSSTGTAEPRLAEELYNEGFAKRKTINRCRICKQHINSFEFIQLFCCFQKKSSPKYKNKYFVDT